MRITKRVTNVRRHTVGFVLDGATYVTRGEAVKMAEKNLLTGYYVSRAATGRRYIASLPNHRLNTLNNLPVVVND